MKRFRSEIIISLFLVITTLIVYWQVLNHNFLNYDDWRYVVENQHVNSGWTFEGLTWAFTTLFHRHWHPITWLSHMTDCQFFGLNPTGHHLTNLLLHIANTLLLFFVFRKMTAAPWRSAFVAALFSLHPLHVETVAWVADRKDLLSAFFWMLTMGAYVGYSTHPKLFRYMLVILFFVLGLMSKATVVTLPAVFLLMDYWPLGRFQFVQSGNHSELKNSNRSKAVFKKTTVLRLFLEKLLFFILLVVSAVIAISAIQKKQITFQNLEKLWLTKTGISTAMVNYVKYIGKMLWPTKLTVSYLPVGSIPMWHIAGAGMLLALITVLVIFWARRKPYLLTGWLWYIITLAPVVGFVGGGPSTIADRYTYIPLIGLFIIVAWGIPDILAKWQHRRVVLAFFVTLVLFSLMICSWRQSRYWKNDITLLTHAINVTKGNYIAHTDLGVDFAQKEMFKDAIRHFSEALRINPNFADAHQNMGNALVEQGKYKKAIGHFNKALRIRPYDAEIHYQLGITMFQTGNVKDAIKHFSKALQINPNFVDAHYSLGIILRGQTKYREAIAHFNKVLQIRPDDAGVHNQLGATMMRLGDMKKAVRHFSEALRIEPDYSIAQHNLKVALRLLNKSAGSRNTMAEP